MKREYSSSSSSSMNPQNSQESNQETASSALQLQETSKPCCSELKQFDHQPDPDINPRLLLKEFAATSSSSAVLLTPNTRTSEEGSRSEDNGRERLKRHRVEVAGRVWIPDIWGQEDLLKDWIDCSAFDAAIMNASIMSARAALVEEGRRANSSRLRI
ncbi:hypothetical protein ACH5RR_005608 [Cinchona calisaya]|uniref:Protein BIC1 n=1 Tax=Cinchona calisaya TaxID=153742 RepID=A0ABD3ALQ5_9GENT